MRHTWTASRVPQLDARLSERHAWKRFDTVCAPGALLLALWRFSPSLAMKPSTEPVKSNETVRLRI